MDKKNTLLLTVIAIATLLVAVVGATFAYFTAQNGAAATANMEVKTSTTNTATISEFKDIKINANFMNFKEVGQEETGEVGSQKGETSGSISFTATDAEGTETQKYCYKVVLEVTSNNFEYSLTDNAPELIFSISKAAKQTTEPETYTEYTSAIGQDATSLTYDGSVKSGARVCLNDASDETHADTYYAYSCTDGQDIKGYDITTKGNAAKGSTSPFKIEIPRLDTDTVNSNANVHEIDADKGQKVTDYWKASVTFVNYDDKDLTDEGGIKADQQKNTDKTFNAALNFVPVSCTDGSELGKD